MASCKDCIHERVCEKLCPRGLLPYQSSEYPAELFCLEFKSRADIVEVKRGEWIKRGNEKKCSVCGFIYYSNKDEWNCCPNCGAKMDGKDTDVLTKANVDE